MMWRRFKVRRPCRPYPSAPCAVLGLPVVAELVRGLAPETEPVFAVDEFLLPGPDAPSVDEALKDIAEKRERRSRIAELHQFRRATTPMEDAMGLFEWKVVGPAFATSHLAAMNGSQGIAQWQAEGYELVGEYRCVDGVFVYMRRMRDNPMLEGLSDLLRATEAGEDGEATDL